MDFHKAKFHKPPKYSKYISSESKEYSSKNQIGRRIRDRGSSQMHDATCGKCGASCQIPFEPRQGKPVLCSDCFRTTKPREDRRPRDRDNRHQRDDRRPRDRDSKTQMHDATCAKCGTSCQIPFEPRQGRDVLCSDCFRTTKPRESRYQRDDRSPRHDRRRQGRIPRRDKREKIRDDSFRKNNDRFEGGSETFYANLREKLFEILGGKKCTNCGFSDERALGFSDVDDKAVFDNIRRGGAASSWGKYISDPNLARKKLRVLCLNCNQTK